MKKMTESLADLKEQNEWEVMEYKTIDDYSRDMAKERVFLIVDNEENEDLYDTIYNSFFFGIIKINGEYFVEGLALEWEADEEAEIEKWIAELEEDNTFVLLFNLGSDK